MSKATATICSLLPYQLTEVKPGLNPTEFIIPKAPKDGFSLTLIPDDVYYLINPDPLAAEHATRYIAVPVPALKVAQSIIDDYITASLGVEPPTIMPGLFAVSGEWYAKDFGIEHIEHLIEYRSRQNEWYKNLINIADDMWAKTHSPIAISDIQRSALRALDLHRDWEAIVPPEHVEKCAICREPVNPGALKCHKCGHILNKAEYDKVMAATK